MPRHSKHNQSRYQPIKNLTSIVMSHCVQPWGTYSESVVNSPITCVLTLQNHQIKSNGTRHGEQGIHDYNLSYQKYYLCDCSSDRGGKTIISCSLSHWCHQGPKRLLICSVLVYLSGFEKLRSLSLSVILFSDRDNSCFIIDNTIKKKTRQLYHIVCHHSRVHD